jgi:hypothetical protein
MIDIKLTQEQAQTLAHLLDLAVRSGGMKAALDAVPLVQVIQQAIYDSTKPQPPKE